MRLHLPLFFFFPAFSPLSPLEKDIPQVAAHLPPVVLNANVVWLMRATVTSVEMA